MARTPARLGRADVKALLGLEKAVMDRFETYLEALLRWNQAINLVAKGTLDDAWRRHILDSAQLWDLRPARLEVHVDMGSGAGLPGLVLAMMGPQRTHLVESDRRKAAFLRDTAARMSLNVEVHDRRLEDMAALPADLVTARALAPLDRLVSYANIFIHKETRLLFLEGRSGGSELTGSEALSTMPASARLTSHASRSSADGRIVMLDGLNPDEVQ